jgi:hypothetical protein
VPTRRRRAAERDIPLQPIYDEAFAEHVDTLGHAPGQGELTPEDLRAVKKAVAASKKTVAQATQAKTRTRSTKTTVKPRGGSGSQRGLGQVRMEGQV